jgi:hypothetical protein
MKGENMNETIPLPATEVGAGLAESPQSPTINPPLLLPQAKGESDRAFEAFRAYLELGPKRRYAAVGRKLVASLRTVKRWANDRLAPAGLRDIARWQEVSNCIHLPALSSGCAGSGGGAG